MSNLNTFMMASSPARPSFMATLTESSVVDWVRRLVRWCVRFRHRCGYGIHSPYAFNFVTGVIYERAAYYAYDAIHAAYAERCRNKRSRSVLREKDCRLLFRVANFQQPATYCLLSPMDDLLLRCMQMGAQRMQQVEVPSQADLLLLDARCCSALQSARQGAEVHSALSTLRPNGLLLLMHTDRVHKVVCDALRKSLPPTCVSYDLGCMMFFFNRPDLNAQHYVINYF